MPISLTQTPTNRIIPFSQHRRVVGLERPAGHRMDLQIRQAKRMKKKGKTDGWIQEAGTSQAVLRNHRNASGTSRAAGVAQAPVMLPSDSSMLSA